MTPTRICRNPDCRKPLVRRPGERPNRFLRRVTCGPTCGVSAAHEHQRSTAKPEHIAHCAICEARLVRREHEEYGDFRNRQTCGMECFRKLISRRSRNRVPRTLNTVRRTCQAPGCCEPIVRRTHETLGNFERRKTCSNGCRATLRSLTMSQSTAPNRGGDPRHIGAIQRRNERNAIADIERPTPRQVREYLNSGEAARRLFEPHIAEAARKRAGHAVCLAVEGPPDDSGGLGRPSGRIGPTKAILRASGGNLQESQA